MARATRAGSVFDNSLLGICVFVSILALFLPAQTRDRSAATLRRTISAPFAAMQRRAEMSRAAFLSYDDRMAQLGQLAALRAENEALTSENRRMRDMLALARRLKWGFVPAQASPGQMESDLVQHQILQTFSVTAGSKVGVQPFTPVVSADGLVGMVETVDPASAIAITYSHPDFRVSATTPNDSAFGIVQAHLGNGAERALLEMRGVPFRSPLKPGQPIISSGLGGTYPRGIPVGTVIREISTPEKWARTYLLQPAANLARVGPVFLALKQRVDAEGAAGLASMWMTPQQADSASRAIAAHGDSIARGDSLARDAALRESAARRAALDSVRDSTAVDSTRRPALLPPSPVPTTPRPTVSVPAVTPRSATPQTAPPVRRDTGAAPRAGTPRPTVPRPTVPRPTVPVPQHELEAARP